MTPDIPGMVFPYVRMHVLNKLMARIKKERGCYAVQAATDINVGDYAYLNFDLKGFRHSGSCLAKRFTTAMTDKFVSISQTHRSWAKQHKTEIRQK